jgi:hypothetical protein
MKVELETKSLELLQWLEQAIKSTADFTAEQIPLFIQELLRYNFVMSLSWFICGLLLFIITLYFTYRVIKWLSIGDNWEMSPALFFVVAFMIFPIGLMVNNTDWIKIKLAPRVYLMEYIKEQIK